MDFIHLDQSRIGYWEAGIKEVMDGMDDLCEQAKLRRQPAPAPDRSVAEAAAPAGLAAAR
eukprot:COSAG01_NODE_14487_length_1447_cov_2.751484_3_plen_60_part_00